MTQTMIQTFDPLDPPTADESTRRLPFCGATAAWIASMELPVHASRRSKTRWPSEEFVDQSSADWSR
jgi:hypothetical protein